MKRILSVILSLALLASLLIIPMSVSADQASDVKITEYNKTDISSKWTAENNVALGVVPKLYKFDGTTRTEKLLIYESDIAKLSNGNLSDSNAEVSFDITFKNKVDGVFTDYVNNYTPGEAFNFKQESYDAYVDLVYDLGRPTNIKKFQHIAGSDGALSMGVYQLYASDSATNLFSKDSWICNYQNKDTTGLFSGKKSQEIAFPIRTAQYVAIRCYMPIIQCDKTYNEKAGTENYFYNCFRIGDIAIYGTPSDTAAYKVTEIQAPTGKSDAPTPVPDGDLLTDKTFESIKSFENGKLVRTDEKFYKREEYLGKLNSQTYYDAGHGNFDLGVVFYANNTCKNGYSIDRTNTNGNITFTVPTEAPTVYYDFTYDLGDYYKIDRFGAYLNSAMDRRIQAYEVYIGNDRASLYTGEPVVVYNNYYNTYGQTITFDQAKIGKYIGFRVLNPSTINDDGNTYVRIDELAAYGTRVGTPPAINVEYGCGSAKLTVTPDANNNNTITSVKYSTNRTDYVDAVPDAEGKYPITGIGDYTVVATDDKGNVTTKEFTVEDHDYKYTVDGAVITETCGKGDLEAKTLTLTKPATIVYDSNDKSGSIDVVKMTGFANAAGKGDIVFKNGETTVTEVKDAGNYVAELTIEGVTARLPFTIQQADLDHKDYAAPTVDDIEAGTTLGSEAFGANKKGAFKWAEPDTKVEYGSHTYKATFTPTDNNFKTVENIDVTVNGKDTTAPTGEIKIKDKTWIEKIVNVVFGWFINEQETVTITGSDAGSGVKAVYYYVADAKLDSFENIEWKEYPEEGFKIEKEGNNVVYAKIVDRANNETVISTDGIVLDTKAPSADVTLGKYYGSLTVTVTEDNLKTVELNGKVVTLEDGKFIVPAADKKQKIVIKDKADNETTYEVTVVEVKGLDKLPETAVIDVNPVEENDVDKDIVKEIKSNETVYHFEINLDKVSGGAITDTGEVVLEIPVDFDFAGKVDIRVLHNHGGNVRVLDALTARPTADFKDGTFFADTTTGKLYIYSSKFSAFAVAYHVHDLKHVEAKAATAEADGNIEYWYCEGCDKYFSDAAATKEIQKADTVVKYVAPSNGNTGSGSNAPTTGGETENNATVPGGTSPVTGETAMTVVLFAILLGALAVMGISIVKSRKAKSK